MFKTLAGKLIISFVLVSLIPIVTIAGWTIREAIVGVETQAQMLLDTASSEQYHAIEERVRVLSSQITLLAQNYYLRTGNASGTQTVVDDVKKLIAGADTVFVTDLTGRSTLNSSRGTFDLSERAYFKQATIGQTAREVVISKDTGKAVIVVASPIHNLRGDISGVVGLTIDIAQDSAFTFAPMGKTGERYMVNSEGYFLTQSRFIEDAVLKQKAAEQVQAMFKSGAQNTYFGRYPDYRGVEVYGSLSYVPSLNWVVVAETDAAEMFETVYTTGKGLIVLGIIALIISAGVSWLVAKRIALRILPVSQGAQNVAKGDLSFAYTPITDNDEIGELSRAFGTMLTDLRNLVGHMQTSSGTLAERAGMISGNIAEVAAGNDSQASITQEITRTIEQLAAATQEIAANAQNASSASENARVAASDGAERVGKSITALKSVQASVSQLAEASKKIGNIVTTIEEISDQTNLLALNAAIEAARAGEHGRGFAVVADAVRGLAEQSRQSTREITRLISSIQSQINDSLKISTEGAEGARYAQESLDNIIAQVNNIAVMVEEISAAGEEQAASANEVAASMENLGAITEEVAASSQETSEAGASLAELGKSLQEVAKRFKL